MTDAQQTARLVVRLSEENRLLRKRERRLEKALREIVTVDDAEWLLLATEANLARWRKVLNS